MFAHAAGLIFVPLTMALDAGVAEQDATPASSMSNVSQQFGDSLGLTMIGKIA